MLSTLILADLFPMPPQEGPPLPRFLKIYWPSSQKGATTLSSKQKPMADLTVDGLTLISDSRAMTWYDQQYSITCYHEDANHQRHWAGNLPAGGSFIVPLEMCPLIIEGVPSYVGPGGTSIRVWAYAQKGLELTVTAPSGRVYTARSTLGKGRKETLSRCVLSDTYGGSIGIGTLEPGTYIVELRNNSGRKIRDIEFMVSVQLGCREWQKTTCDPADWNFA